MDIIFLNVCSLKVVKVPFNNVRLAPQPCAKAAEFKEGDEVEV